MSLSGYKLWLSTICVLLMLFVVTESITSLEARARQGARRSHHVKHKSKLVAHSIHKTKRVARARHRSRRAIHSKHHGAMRVARGKKQQARRHTSARHKRSLTRAKISRRSMSGKATIYHDKFHGRRTASGERFSQGGLTAASPYLPMGSKVLVKNRANGKSVTLRINDRQAKGGGRVIDLSKAAARRLGVKGTAPVTVHPK